MTKMFRRKQVCMKGYKASINIALLSVILNEPETCSGPRLIPTLSVLASWLSNRRVTANDVAHYYQTCATTIRRACYSEMVTPELTPPFWAVLWWLLSMRIMSFKWNACVNTAAHTLGSQQNRGRRVVAASLLNFSSWPKSLTFWGPYTMPNV